MRTLISDLASLPLRAAGRLAGPLPGALGRKTFDAFAHVPEAHVRLTMHSPLRRPALDALFHAAPWALSRTRAHEVVTLVRWHVTGRTDGAYDIFWLEYADGRWRVWRGGAGEDERAHPDGGPGRRPELTLTVEATELIRLASGRSNLARALLTGALRASGQPAVAARLTGLLRTSSLAARTVER